MSSYPESIRVYSHAASRPLFRLSTEKMSAGRVTGSLRPATAIQAKPAFFLDEEFARFFTGLEADSKDSAAKGSIAFAK